MKIGKFQDSKFFLQETEMVNVDFYALPILSYENIVTIYTFMNFTNLKNLRSSDSASSVLKPLLDISLASRKIL